MSFSNLVQTLKKLIATLWAKITSTLESKMDRLPNQRRALFILKIRQDYGSYDYSANHLATGMYNSAKFVSDMLVASGVASKVVIVIDNNDIDREVTQYKPTHVFIEGIWVVPPKFAVLQKLHPTVKWIIRCHSEIPFLAQEGNAIDWIFEYLKSGVYVSGNSSRINEALQSLVGDVLDIEPQEIDQEIPYLPNYYPADPDFELSHKPETETFNIGCFGAIRPLKNQLIQAIAAVEFAKARGANLVFHINQGRIEQNGGNQLKNIRSLFSHLGAGYTLVEHDWMDHPTFLQLLQTMDICMQVSMSETFNIVTADAVSVGVPVVVSHEVTWAASDTFANPTDIDNIVATLNNVWDNRDDVVQDSFDGLVRYSERSKHLWTKYLRGH